jgi:uncharacterized protein (DUF2164 family)
MEIQLNPAIERSLQAPIRRFVEEMYGQTPGELGTRQFLEFCLKEIGPAIYNQAVADAQAYLQGQVADLENVCFATESSYWGDPRGVRRKPERK